MIRLGIAIILVGCIGMLLPVSIDEFALFGLVIMGLGCAPIYSIYHPCNTFQFRREELPGDHRYPDGK